MDKENSSENKWSDDLDFGLPKVDLNPINRTKANPKKSKPTPIPAETPSPVESPKATLEVPMAAVEPVFPPHTESTEEILESSPAPAQEQSNPPSDPVQKKQSNSWVWIAASVLVFLVAVILWQMQSQEPEILSTAPAETGSTQEENLQNQESDPVVSEIPTETQGSEDETLAGQDSGTESEPSENTQTGTTIEQSSTGELIRVESKPSPSQYFIVVGSLPNERLALEESEKYWDRANELYLISPYGDSRNYRLAIGKYTRFTEANAELQRVKGDYTEALWILKY
ncbi:SPOR domain-containing protein [Algoriphagus namhaensis]